MVVQAKHRGKSITFEEGKKVLAIYFFKPIKKGPGCILFVFISCCFFVDSSAVRGTDFLTRCTLNKRIS